MSNKSQIFFTILCLGFSAWAHADLIDGEDLVDPTRPLFFSGSNEESSEVVSLIRNVVPASYDLSFIRSGSSPVAVINTERVTVGDVIGGATVLSIDRSTVTLMVNGQEQRISLYGESVKSPVTQ